MAPRPKPVDKTKLKALLEIGATDEEAAAVLGVSPDTLTRRYADLIKTHRLIFKVSVRREQMRLLRAGNATMGVWLGKQVLGQKDNLTVAGDEEAPVRMKVLQELPTKELEALANKLAALVGGAT